MAEWWTNTSLPPSTSINPKPFLSLNHFTRPVIGTSTDCHGIETPGEQYCLYYVSIPQKKQKLIYQEERCPLSLKTFLHKHNEFFGTPDKTRARINISFPLPDYTLLWGHKMHPGQPPSPACGLFLKCSSSRVWRERDRQRLLTPPLRSPHMPQNRNPYQNLCISRVSPCYPSFCPKRLVKPGQHLLSRPIINHSSS